MCSITAVTQPTILQQINHIAQVARHRSSKSSLINRFYRSQTRLCLICCIKSCERTVLTITEKNKLQTVEAQYRIKSLMIVINKLRCIGTIDSGDNFRIIQCLCQLIMVKRPRVNVWVNLVIRCCSVEERLALLPTSARLFKRSTSGINVSLRQRSVLTLYLQILTSCVKHISLTGQFLVSGFNNNINIV